MLVCVRKGITGIAILKRAEEGVEEYIILHLVEAILKSIWQCCSNVNASIANFITDYVLFIIIILHCLALPHSR